MVTAELEHNPYLKETTVSFNNKPPRINSQIEKYADKPLKDWVSKVPKIFHDEMNGYDFDLLFTGTEPDFVELQQAFDAAGVAREDVRLIHKGEIDDPSQKRSKIGGLITWLRNHPNRLLDYETFFQENRDAFEDAYPYIIIGSDMPVHLGAIIHPESVERLRNIENMNLTGIPILFVLTSSNFVTLREDLSHALDRSDIQQTQLFFMICDPLNREKVTRLIHDLGVCDPQIVTYPEDPRIIKYMRSYPITEHVHEAIDRLRIVYKTIEPVLEADIHTVRTRNADTYARIDQLTDEINRLKEVDDTFTHRNSYIPPRSYVEAVSTLQNRLSQWNVKKIKVTDLAMAEESAENYVAFIEKAAAEFTANLSNITNAAKRAIGDDLREKYISAGIDVGYRPSDLPLKGISTRTLPNVKAVLMGLKSVTYQDAPDGGIFGAFRHVPQKGHSLAVTIWPFDQWRASAQTMITSLAEDMVEELTASLKQFHSELTKVYRAKIDQLIKAREAEKKTTALNMSTEEQVLQKDSDWLTTFGEKLTHIERG